MKVDVARRDGGGIDHVRLIGPGEMGYEWAWTVQGALCNWPDCSYCQPNLPRFFKRTASPHSGTCPLREAEGA